MNGSGFIPRSLPLGMGVISAGAAIPRQIGLGGNGGGNPPSPSPFPPGGSGCGPAGDGVGEEWRVCGGVSALYFLLSC